MADTTIWGLSIPVMLWLGLAVLLAVIEIFTAGFFCIFFAGGALISAIMAWFFPQDFTLQVTAFFLGSLLNLALLRPVLKETLKISDKPAHLSNIQALIETPALVLERVDKFNGKVKVLHTGETWTAYLAREDASVIEAGSEVLIEKIDGAKLAVYQK